MISLRLILSLMLAPAAVAAQAPCIDPAAPLRTLAADYYNWPEPPTGERPQEAWAHALAYFETGDEGRYRRARLAYENLEKDHPRDRHVKMALGVLYVAGPELSFRRSDGYRHVPLMPYTNAEGRAVRHLQDVVAADSTQWLAGIAMTRIALLASEGKRIDEAIALLDRMLAAMSRNVPLRLARGDLLVRQTRYDEALAQLPADRADCAPVQHARAEALMLAGDTATGSRLYLQTLAEGAPADLHRFHDDIRVMMSVAQNAAFDSVPVTERGRWMTSFWNRSAAASGRTLQTRVAEQTIRAAYANANFRARYLIGDKSQDRLAIVSDTSHVVPWDAAGVYFVRHGPPDKRLRTREAESSFEAWVYTQMEPPVILLMQATVAPRSDWVPMLYPRCPSVSSIGRMNVEETRARISSGKFMDMRDIYWALGEYDPRFYEIVQDCALVVMGMKRIRYENYIVDFSVANKKLFRTMPQQESSLPHYLKPVRMAIAAYQFRDYEGVPEVVALASVPVRDLTAPPRARRINITYAVTDSLIESMRTDTTLAVPLNVSDGLVRPVVTWTKPAITRGTLRINVTDAADTLRGGTKAVAFIVRPDSDPVSLSDLVIADVGVTGPLVRGTHRLSPLPDHTVRVDDTFRVFFEMYGVRAGERIVTTLQLKRSDPKTAAEQLGLKRRDERTISFAEEVELDGSGVAFRDIDVTGDLQPGRYTIEATITTPAGVTARRTGTLVVQ